MGREGLFSVIYWELGPAQATSLVNMKTSLLLGCSQYQPYFLLHRGCTFNKLQLATRVVPTTGFEDAHFWHFLMMTVYREHTPRVELQTSFTSFHCDSIIVSTIPHRSNQDSFIVTQCKSMQGIHFLVIHGCI